MDFFRKNTGKDEELYQEIFYRYDRQVYKYVWKKLRNRDNAMDVVQNVFSALWHYRYALFYGDTESIIFKTCNQEIARFLKTVKKHPLYMDELHIIKADSSAKKLKAKLQKEQLLDDINQNINQLPELTKQIFILNKLQGITQEKISLQFNIPKRTVKSRVSQAMAYLKAIYRDSEKS
ncbi:hypothetical protein BAY13_17160 [Elizabethkingia bruuniana]|uniref:RNA polymerase sigma factor n=1 Tax=Elizabethkingia bruuniana TaxID=1756149 RepID=UPI00099A8F78|nr:RNA polymerase sigma factor [Elizabethkingia bruuniana]OPC66464.1 hypothetical protein BAY13_17160 [Elizabethkingia bruuniana]